MKRNIFLVVAILIVLVGFVTQTQSQTVRISTNLFNGAQFKNSATDSAVGVPVMQNDARYPNLLGQYPDSIKVRWFASADSTQRVLIRIKSGNTQTSTYSSALLDSVKSTTKALSVGEHVLTTATYFKYDQLGVSLVAADTINATVKANASKIWLWIERYFHK